MYASGQNLVGGHAITVFNAAGTQTGSFTFPGNLPNGANQAKMLIATTQAESFFNVTADLVMSASVLSAGGKVCWAGTLDCVAWGSYHGGSAGVGTPFNASSGLTSGRAAARRLNISGSSTVLDAGDDTDNSATDFVFATPAPRNNAGTLGQIPSATCGNGVIEGLEQCDDHNVSSGDGCSSTCKIEAVVVDQPAPQDFNGDGRSDVFWRNSSTGSNAIWKSANKATQQATAAVTSQSWKVVGVGDFNDDGKADVFWRNTSTGSNAIWRSANQATQQAVAAVTSQSWIVAGVGDFTGDGNADVMWRNTSTGANAIWKSANKATQQPVSAVTSQSWIVAGIGDFNGDGKSDVLWRNRDTGANAIWISANKATQQAVAAVTDEHWKAVGVGDFNGDGRADVLWRNTETGANAIWRSANKATQQAVSAVTSQSWQVAEVADFNGDGKADILWRNGSTGANAIWVSANKATQQAVSAVTDLAWKIVPYQGQSLSGSSSSSVAMSMANVTTAEGNSGTHVATFTVALSKAAGSTVTYDIATSNGTAVAGSDYVAASATHQAIPAGTMSKTFPVTIMGDTTYEDGETFTVRLSNVSGAVVSNATATGVISNDDSYYPGVAARP
jgi:cysteine-rich repeat protein